VNYNPGDPSEAALAIAPELTSGDLEFIELHNPTDAAIDLTHWRIRGGASYDFDEGTMIDAGETFVIIQFNPENVNNANRVSAFRTHYGIGNVRILGGYGGQLSSNGDRLQLQSPDFDVVDPTDPNHVYEDHPRYLAHADDGWSNPTGCVCGTPACPWSEHIQTCWFTPYLPDVRWQNPAAAAAARADHSSSAR